MYIDERQNLGENAQRIFFIHFHGNFLSFHGISQYPNPVTTQGNLQKIQSKLMPLTLNILFITLQSACIHIPSYQHEHKYPNISVSTETNKFLMYISLRSLKYFKLCTIHFWWSTHQILQITKQFYIPHEGADTFISALNFPLFTVDITSPRQDYLHSLKEQ